MGFKSRKLGHNKIILPSLKITKKRNSRRKKRSFVQHGMRSTKVTARKTPTRKQVNSNLDSSFDQFDMLSVVRSF